MIGQTLAHYEITASLGAGGMGEVYRAHDTKLKRDVAIKVLPPAFVDDDNRRARFEREAELLASLNHPNIAQIYGIESLDDVHALVIELVEGPTLADRIAEGPLPADEALSIAGQIADALETAHSQGIVHRDLKPANIKLKDDGTVKVLDFGIAKALETRADSGAIAPALTLPAETEAGIVLGTAAYMSPEQARGKAIDQRADIWAFGCVLYEMLTGQPTFAGEDRTSTIARVLERQIDTSALPKDLAPSVEHTVKLCLEKDVRKRVADIRDVRLALAGTFETAAIDKAHETPPARSRAWLTVAAALAVGAITTWIAVQTLRTPPEPAPVARLQVTLPSSIGYLGLATGLGGGAVSPDGRHVVVRGRSVNRPNVESQLWLRSLDSLEARPLPGTIGGRSPFWSFDSSTIAFTVDGVLKRVGIDGVSAVTIANARPSLSFSYGAWSSDDVILYRDADWGLSRIRANGTESAPVTGIDNSSGWHEEIPIFLPDQRHFLFFGHYDVPPAGRQALDQVNRPTGIYLGDIEAGPDAQPYTLIAEADDGPAFVEEPGGRYGYVLYVRDGTLLAKRLDTESVSLADDNEIPLHAPVSAVSGSPAQGIRSFTASRDGSVVMLEFLPEQMRLMGALFGNLANQSDSEPEMLSLSWITPDNDPEPLPLAPRAYYNVRVSPDGERIAATIDGGIWLSPTESPLGWTRRVLDGTLLDWSPDGDRILFMRLDEQTSQTTLYTFSVTSNEDAEPILSFDRGVIDAVWSEEDLLVLAMREPQTFVISIYTARLDGESPEVESLIPASGSNVGGPAISPNGDLIAYVGLELGPYAVYVDRFPDLGNKQLVSNDSGSGRDPAWFGEALYFVRSTFTIGEGVVTVFVTMMVAELEDPASPRFGSPTESFTADDVVISDFGRNWDIAADGRFLMLVREQLDADDEEPATALPKEATADRGDIVILQNLIQNLPD